MRTIIVYTESCVKYLERLKYIGEIEPEVKKVRIININTGEEERYEYSFIRLTETSIEIWTNKAGLSPAQKQKQS